MITKSNPFAMRIRADFCEICKKVPAIVEHHISYIPRKTIFVCWSCHSKIHGGSLEEFKPKDINGVNPAKILYSTKNWIRDSKGRMVRPLTSDELLLKQIMKNK